VANSEILIYLKTQAKKWLLTSTLFISFFAFSGYVSNNLPNNNRAPDTEVLADKSFILKSGISYKRAALFFYKNTLSCFIIRENFDLGISHYNKREIDRYQHLKQLFLFTKRTVNYPINHLYYTADQGPDITPFQIG
jgi:hypothetical protein